MALTRITVNPDVFGGKPCIRNLRFPVSRLPSLVDWLGERSHAAVHAQDLGLAEASDSVVLARAKSESRGVITADLDFGRLLAFGGATSPGVILFRGGNYSDKQMQNLLA